MNDESMSQFDVEDVTVEELGETTGSGTVGSASSVGTVSTPASAGTAACIGSGG